MPSPRFADGCEAERTILIVEDDPDIVEMLEYNLQEEGYDTIAALNGPAIGAGGCLALACDMRIAAQEAKLGFTFIKLGINPGMGSEYFLSRLVGPARTLELLMTGDILTAEEALQIGLVNRVVLSKDLQEYVKQFAGRIAAISFSCSVIPSSKAGR